MIVKKLKNNEIAYFVLHVLLVALGLTHYFGISILNIGISIVIAIILCLAPLNVNVVMLFMAAPFFNLFSIEMGSISYYYIFVVIYIVKYLITRQWKINKIKLIIIIAFFVLSLFWMNIYVQISWFLLFLVLVLNYQDDAFLTNFVDIVKHISISTVTSSIIGYVMLIEGKSAYTNSYIYQEEGNVIRFAGLVGDSVFFGQFAVIITATVLSLVFMGLISKGLGYVLSIVLSIFIVLTYSKTSIILLIFVVISYFIAVIIKNVNKRKNLIYSIFLFIIFISLIIGGYIYIQKHMNNQIMRMYVLRFKMNDLWTGRLEIASSYIKKITSSIAHLFVGMPYSEYTDSGVMVGRTMITKAHNVYIETICLFGLIPSLVIFGFCIKKIVTYFISRKNLLFIVPVFVLLLSGISLHGHIEWPYYFLVSISFGLMDFVQKAE